MFKDSCISGLGRTLRGWHALPNCHPASARTSPCLIKEDDEWKLSVTGRKINVVLPSIFLGNDRKSHRLTGRPTLSLGGLVLPSTVVRPRRS